MLLLLLACTPLSPSDSNQPDTDTDADTDSDTDTDADTDTDTDTDAPAEECADGVDNDGDGDVDTLDADCRGHIQAAQVLRSGSTFEVSNLDHYGDEVRLLGVYAGGLTFEGSAVSTGEGFFAAAVSPAGVTPYPTLLDGTNSYMYSAEWSDTGFTGVVIVRTDDLVDSVGTVAEVDTFDVLVHPDVAHALVLGGLNYSHPYGTSAATTAEGDVCVGGYIEDMTLDDAGALVYSSGDWATILGYWPSGGGGPTWTMGVTATEYYIQNAAVVPWGDRCFVAVPYGENHAGILAPYMTNPDGVLLLTVDRDQHIEVLDELYSEGAVEVKAWGPTSETGSGGAWLQLAAVGLTTAEGVPLGDGALVAWDETGAREPWIGGGTDASFVKADRVGPSDYIVMTHGAGTLEGDASGSYGEDGAYAVSRITTTGGVWTMALGPDTTETNIYDSDFSLDADGNVLAAFAQAESPATYGAGTLEAITNPGTVGRNDGSLVLLTLTP